MKKILLLLVLFISVIACEKDDKIKALTPAEQAEVDQDQIIEYLKTYKFEDYYKGSINTHLDWKIIPLADDDSEDTETLYDLMSENVIETKYNDINYKMYYYIFDEGIGETPADEDRVFVDYNVFQLYSTEMSQRIDYTTFFPVPFQLPDLIEGWKLGMKKFKSGDTSGLDIIDYRKETNTPGRGILIIPSGLAYNSGVLRFDIVLYHNEVVEEEIE